jgi:hypothetical protein
MLRHRRLVALTTQLALILTVALGSATARANGGRDLIRAQDLKEWLGYISSDELEGRSTFSEGLGLAAAYIAEHLSAWGVKPGGDKGSYFQRVAVLGVKSDNHSTLSVEVNGQTRTFKNKEGVTFPANVGGKRSVTSDQIEFLGYGLNAPLANHNDYAGKSVKGKVVVWLGRTGPKGLDAKFRRAVFGRSRYATEQEGAVASIGEGFTGGLPGRPPAEQPTGGEGRPGGPPGQQVVPIESADFTTVQRLDSPIPPSVSGQDEFFEFLFSGSDVKYSDLKEKASKGEPIPTFTLKNVKITINLDADYRVVRTQYTRNVVGIVEGSDPSLRNTYVAFGAHYDHVGYSEGEIVQTANGPRRAQPRGRVTEGAIDDRVWNGADDDGSGTVTILSVAKAFALGPKPRRSLLFVWHSGEERGLWGSRYYADHPSVSIDKIVAQINMDMVGRNQDNKPDEFNTVYPVGSDRISTDLHNTLIDANNALSKPLSLNFELNDPTDLEQVYYRSDHYSYAAKGIPIVFLTTGLHQDYHANTDSAEKINYEKMTRVGQLSYETAWRVANSRKAPVRDNLGPRVGKGSRGKLKA